MAKDAGAIDSGDFPRKVGGEPDGAPFEWDYSYFIFNHQQMPAKWNDDAKTRGYKLGFDWYAYTPLGSSLTAYVVMHSGVGGNGTMGVSTTATTGAWGNGGAPTTSVVYTNGTRVMSIGWSSLSNSLPRMQVCQFQAQHTNGYADSDVYGIYVEQENDLDYTGSWSPVNHRWAEAIDRDTANNRAYSEMRPASSWMVQDQSQTLNNFLYESRLVWTLPLFGGP